MYVCIYVCVDWMEKIFTFAVLWEVIMFPPPPAPCSSANNYKIPCKWCRWMEACLNTELPPASELEGALRNGVVVAKLAMFFAPDVVKQKNIYDFDESIYKVRPRKR